MVELFSRTESLVDMPDSGTVPIHIDEDVSSLSAILLNEDYYQLLQSGKNTVSDIVLLKPEFLIVFKAKAFLDIKARRANAGLEINDEVKKHLKDVVRLSTVLSDGENPDLPEGVKVDMAFFLLSLNRILMIPSSWIYQSLLRNF